MGRLYRSSDPVRLRESGAIKLRDNYHITKLINLMDGSHAEKNCALAEVYRIRLTRFEKYRNERTDWAHVRLMEPLYPILHKRLGLTGGMMLTALGVCACV